MEGGVDSEALKRRRLLFEPLLQVHTLVKDSVNFYITTYKIVEDKMFIDLRIKLIFSIGL
jgi:hypothetical protein